MLGVVYEVFKSDELFLASMKTPLIRFFGGKSKQAKMICSMMPDHLIYVEPFFGGGSVFFKKKKAKIEIINDLDSELYNFWKVVKNNGKQLREKLDKFLYFEDEYKRAKELLKNGDDVERAYAFFLSINMSFLGKKFGGLAYSVTNHGKNEVIYMQNSILKIEPVIKRLHATTIFNRPALKIIEMYKEASEAFFYLDPPYPKTTQNAYKYKFTIEDFNTMLELLKNIKGKFLLSCYLKDDMQVDKSWRIREYKKHFTAKDNTQIKSEVLIYNYDDKEFQDGTLGLF